MRFRPMPGKNVLDFLPWFLLGAIVLMSAYSLINGMMMAGQPTTYPDKAAMALMADPAYENWEEGHRGYQAALSEQAKTKAPMLVYFYAPWCPYCKKLHEHLLSSSELQAGLKPYLKVRIYPEDKGSPESALMTQYGASGFPTLYVRFPDGRFEQVDIHEAETDNYLSPQAFLTRLNRQAKL